MYTARYAVCLIRHFAQTTPQAACSNTRDMSSDSWKSDVLIEYEPIKDDTEFIVPCYPIRKNEDLTQLKARLTYQSRKRGVSENGLILATFFSEQKDTLTREQLDQFDRLINIAESDWDIYYWVTGKEAPPPPFDSEVLKLLQDFAQNKEMKDRTRQPDLQF